MGIFNITLPVALSIVQARFIGFPYFGEDEKLEMGGNGRKRPKIEGKFDPPETVHLKTNSEILLVSLGGSRESRSTFSDLYPIERLLFNERIYGIIKSSSI